MKKQLDNWTRQRLMRLRSEAAAMHKIRCERTAAAREREIAEIEAKYEIN